MAHKTIMILGHGRHGKDESALILESLTNLQYAGSSSVYLAEFVAHELNVSVRQAFEERHENRDFWYTLGKRLRASDPGLLVRKCLDNGNIVAGFRELCEIEWAVNSGRIQHVIWVERNFETDPTMDFTLSDVSRTIAHSVHDVTLDVVFNKSLPDDVWPSALRSKLIKFCQQYELI